MSPTDSKHAAQLMKVMREADQVIPPDLERMAAFGGGFGGPTRSRYGGGGGGGGGYGELLHLCRPSFLAWVYA